MNRKIPLGVAPSQQWFKDIYLVRDAIMRQHYGLSHFYIVNPSITYLPHQPGGVDDAAVGYWSFAPRGSWDYETYGPGAFAPTGPYIAGQLQWFSPVVKGKC